MLGAATAIATCKWHARVEVFFSGDRTTFYGPLVGAFASLIGFVFAVFSVVVAMVANDRLRLVRVAGGDVRIFRAFRISVGWCALATLTALVALVIDRPPASNKPWLLGVIIFVSVAASFSVYRCLQLLYELSLAVRAREDVPPVE